MTALGSRRRGAFVLRRSGSRRSWQLHLAANGLRIARGTIVDAVVAKAEIINAPASTKNSDKARDPEMRQTRKGNQWYFRYVALCGRTSSPNQRGSSRRAPWRGIRQCPHKLRSGTNRRG